MPARVTLARALSKLGACSRSQARLVIAAGRVRIDGRPVLDPDLWIRWDQRIELDGAPLSARPRTYLAFHKPLGYITTRQDELGRATVFDLLPQEQRTLIAVGRLDLDSSGLLLLTNDTHFGEAVTSPDHRIEKEYRVRTLRPVDSAALDRLRRPIRLTDGTLLAPFEIVAAPPSWIVTIREGKNRQIRRAFESLGHEVVELHRLRIGPVDLGDLAPATTRPLTAQELAELWRQARA